MGFGRLFRKSYGSTRVNSGPRFRKATKKEIRDANKEETLAQATRRIGESYYGVDYNRLTKEQKAYARQKAKDFRRNLMVIE